MKQPLTLLTDNLKKLINYKLKIKKNVPRTNA